MSDVTIQFLLRIAPMGGRGSCRAALRPLNRLSGSFALPHRDFPQQEPASSPWQKSFADECEGFGPRSRREIAGESVDSSRSRNAEIGPKTRTQSERTSATGC